MRDENAEHLYRLLIYCEHIMQAVRYFDGDYDKFKDDANSRDRYACIFFVEHIGEHVNKLTAEFKSAHSEIGWHEIVGLRNRIVHDFKSVRKATLWTIMVRDIPELNAQCRNFLRELDPTAEADLLAELDEMRKDTEC